MKSNKIKLNIVYFSPTGTTKQILDNIANGINCNEVKEINLLKKQKIIKQTFSEDDIVLIGVPVYAGRVPLTVINRLQKFKASKTRVILVTVYGNRHYDDALLELKDIVTKLGFLPIAAAAFIGVHSFSSAKYPIAEGRPDNDDLKIAKDFGTQVKTAMLKKVIEPQFLLKNKISLQVPGNYPYRERFTKMNIKPEIFENICDLCGKCISLCPVDAISLNNKKITIDDNLCIYCHACVKNCPTKAIAFFDEVISRITQGLFENCKEPKKPEIYLINYD